MKWANTRSSASARTLLSSSLIRMPLHHDLLDALANADVTVDLLHGRFDALRKAPPTLVFDFRVRLEAAKALPE